MTGFIMVQGTSSNAGKSFFTAVLCKIFADRGYKVAPFKSQNTSRNSFFATDGKEIAKAQAFQAFAAGIEPSVEMNPILIKPTGESKAQLIVNGRPFKDTDAREYYDDFASKKGLIVIKNALKKMKEKYGLIFIEGAGSPAEINLYNQDIANMKVADLSNSSVILIADIDRGGVFASIYGTLALLKKSHRKRIKGIVVNKFRGDIEILKPGLNKIEKLTGKPVLGVIPFIKNLEFPEEDSLSSEDKKSSECAHSTFDSVRIRSAVNKSTKISRGQKEVWKKELERAAKIVSKNVDLDRIEEWLNV